MSSRDDLAEEICKAFEMSSVSWTLDNYSHSLSVMFYSTVIRMLERKPFEDAEVQRKVLAFMQEKLDESSAHLLDDAFKQVVDVMVRFDAAMPSVTAAVVQLNALTGKEN